MTKALGWPKSVSVRGTKRMSVTSNFAGCEPMGTADSAAVRSARQRLVRPAIAGRRRNCRWGKVRGETVFMCWNGATEVRRGKACSDQCPMEDRSATLQMAGSSIGERRVAFRRSLLHAGIDIELLVRAK